MRAGALLKWRMTHGRIRRMAGVLAGALLLAAPARALDPRKAITQYAHQVWKTDAGLPQNSIQAILQTRDGYIWLGTERGLVRFDGVQFTVFDKGNTPGLQNSNAQALYEDRAGVLWVGTWGGLHRIQDGRITSLTTRDGLTRRALPRIEKAASPYTRGNTRTRRPSTLSRPSA